MVTSSLIGLLGTVGKEYEKNNKDAAMLHVARQKKAGRLNKRPYIGKDIAVLIKLQFEEVKTIKK